MSAGKYIFIKKDARKLLLIPGILLLCFFQQCSTRKEHKVSTAFYYWKTSYHLNTVEKDILKSTNAHVIYLRLFDVDWDKEAGKALPVGILQSTTLPGADTATAFIPVIYLTQSCLQRLREEDLPELSANISSLISSLCAQYKIDPKEVQIDCDWTKNNADLYFSLLKQLKASDYGKSRLLSCAIRLHQVKFRSASGIPPVDRGLLMVYNMGNLTRYGGQNSILEVKEAKNYLKHLGIYPLPLDVALPVYHWAALFEHGRFKGITYNISRSQFEEVSRLVQKENNPYSIEQDMTIGGYRFKKGQEIRFEATDKKSLIDIGRFISAGIKDTSFRVSFFHLDSQSIQPFNVADLNEIAEAFR